MLQYGKTLFIDMMIVICSRFSTIAEIHKCVNVKYHLSAVSDTNYIYKLMSVIANVQGIVLVSRLLYWTSYSYRL